VRACRRHPHKGLRLPVQSGAQRPLTADDGGGPLRVSKATAGIRLVCGLQHGELRITTKPWLINSRGWFVGMARGLAWAADLGKLY